MEKDTLERLMLDGLTQRQIANKTGVSQTTVRYWILKHRLGVSEKKCKYCGDKLSGRKLSTCFKCRSKKFTLRWDRLRRRAVEYLGGECRVCGYNKYIGALEFHHIDSTQKRWSWGGMKKHSWNDIVTELDKCVLLCSNCHREVESGISDWRV